jgi:hypothetical protein
MNNLVWVFFSMAGFSTPTPCQRALFNPAQTLIAIEIKKNLTSRARAHMTCPREKLRYKTRKEPDEFMLTRSCNIFFATAVVD